MAQNFNRIYQKSFLSSDFLNAIGPDGLTKMLTGFDDKFSEAHCIYALMPIFKLAAATPEYSGKEIVFFRGIARGLIVSPRGSLGWGWDPVFEEERSQLTFGEMDASMKSRFSHRANALTILKKYLEKIWKDLSSLQPAFSLLLFQTQ